VDPFSLATSLTRDGEGEFGWTVPDGWQQGRGAWGGLVVGALLRAVAASEPDANRTLRSLTAQLMAPAPVGPVVVRTRQMRRGSSMSTWSAQATLSSGAMVASLVAIVGHPRAVSDIVDVDTWGTATPPDVPAAADVPRFPLAAPLGPVFASRIHYRPVRGMPASGEPAEAVGWVSFAEPPAPGAEALVALVDAWWPAGLVRSATFRPFATVSFAATVLVDPSTIVLDQPLLHHSRVTGALDGFTSEQRRLWTADGRLAVDNLQSMVIIA
jgi:hypothetical protein